MFREVPGRRNEGLAMRNWCAATRCSGQSEVRSRIDELARRATNKCIERVSERTAVTKEYIIEQLLDNAELARKSGAYGPRNRALELMGKELGMFGDQPPPPSMVGRRHPEGTPEPTIPRGPPIRQKVPGVGVVPQSQNGGRPDWKQAC
jgi:hypothetical protein